MFSLRSSILLLFVLVVPMLLRMAGKEPYPAVLLPAVATVADKHCFKARMIRIFAQTEEGSWKEVDKRKFFAPIPVEYGNFLLTDHLGLNQDTTAKKRFWRRKLTEKSRDELTQWIKIKIAQQGFLMDSVRFEGSEETIIPETSLPASSHITDERSYSLD